MENVGGLLLGRWGRGEEGVEDFNLIRSIPVHVYNEASLACK